MFGKCAQKTAGVTRRELLQAGLTGAAFGAAALGGVQSTSAFAAIPRDYVAQVAKIPRIFCTAYIAPNSAGTGQESVVARYPLVLVPEDIRPHFVKWRNNVRKLNPDILMLGYLNVNSECSVPGPGHDRFRKVQAAWIKSPDGRLPLFNGRRMFDPRQPAWRDALLDAASLVLKSYPYDGLFLDNCTVFASASPIASVRQEMLDGMEEALIRLRLLFPNVILIGNGRYNLRGLNGQMNENRPNDWPAEFAPYTGQSAPRIDLAQVVVSNPSDRGTILAQMKAAQAYGAFFGVARTYQEALWYDFFDQL